MCLPASLHVNEMQSFTFEEEGTISRNCVCVPKCQVVYLRCYHQWSSGKVWHNSRYLCFPLSIDHPSSVMQLFGNLITPFHCLSVTHLLFHVWASLLLQPLKDFPPFDQPSFIDIGRTVIHQLILMANLIPRCLYVASLRLSPINTHITWHSVLPKAVKVSSGRQREIKTLISPPSRWISTLLVRVVMMEHKPW